MGGKVEEDDVLVTAGRSRTDCRHTVLRGTADSGGIGLAIDHTQPTGLEQLHLETHIHRVLRTAMPIILHPGLYHQHTVAGAAQQRLAGVTGVVKAPTRAKRFYLGPDADVSLRSQGLGIIAGCRDKDAAQTYRAVDVGRELAVRSLAQRESEADIDKPRPVRRLVARGNKRRVHSADVVPQRRVHSRGHAPRVDNHLRPQTRARHAAHDHSENQSFYIHL